MTASIVRGQSGGLYPKYHCYRCRGKGTSHKRDTVDEAFIRLLSTLEFNPDLNVAFEEALKQNWLLEQHESKLAKDRIERRISKLQAEDDAIARKNVTGLLNDAQTSRLLKKNEQERADLRVQLKDYDFLDSDLDRVISFGLDALQNIGRVWADTNNPAVQREFQNWLFPVGLRWNGESFGTLEELSLNLCLTTKARIPLKKSNVVDPGGIEPPSERRVGVVDERSVPRVFLGALPGEILRDATWQVSWSQECQADSCVTAIGV